MAPPRQKKPVEVIVFNNPQKKKKVSDSETSKPSSKGNFSKHKAGSPSSSSSHQRPVFNQKQAKYDIRKLGIQGMNKGAKEEAMVDFLVELGAKKPKNKYYHPQVYSEMLKKKREEEKEQEEIDRRSGIKKKKEKTKQKRDKNDKFNYIDGQPGWYKRGVQFVPDDMK